MVFMTMNEETVITVVTRRKVMSDSLNLIPTNSKWFSFADGNSGSVGVQKWRQERS
jgi:hypothetical protein